MKKLTIMTVLIFLFTACDKDKSSAYNSDEERIIGEWYLVKVTNAWGQESILTDNGYTETRKFNNDEMAVYFNDSLYMTYNYELQSEATANGLNAIMVDENIISTYL